MRNIAVRILLAICSASLVSCAAVPDTLDRVMDGPQRFVSNTFSQPQGYEIHGWGISDHQGGNPNNYCQKNPGIGVRIYGKNGWYTGIDAIARNSRRGTATAVGIGYQRRLFNVGSVGIYGGGEFGYMQYTVTGLGMASGPFFFPSAAIKYRGYGVNFAVILPSTHRGAIGLVFLSCRLDKNPFTHGFRGCGTLP